MQRAYLKALHGRYWPYRHHDVPFPIESVVAWYTLFALQDDLGVTGDVLEMGVEHGGTAFLAMMALRDSERLEMIDIKKSPRFADKAAALPQDVADRIVFHECSTRSETLSEIAARQFRFVHIDAGHSKADVLDDMARFVPCVAPDGVLCLDDVFEIRWPGVTEAALEFTPQSGLVPFLFVNRKLYLAHPSMAATYRAKLVESHAILQDLGPLRAWTETMLGAPTMIWKHGATAATLERLVSQEAL